MTIDKEFVATLITIVGATAAIMSKMVTKADLKELDTKLSAKLDKLTEVKADKTDVNQRLISIETFLRVPKPQPAAEKETAAQ